MRMLDAYTCEGGAAHGYALAGWEVEGVDIVPQPRNPYRVHVADAVEFILEHGHSYDAIHASPPCQARTKARRLQGNEHPELDRRYPGGNRDYRAAVRDRDPVLLCGTMFGLRLYRHRLFETNWPLTGPLHGQHYLRQVKMGRRPGADEILQPVGNFSGVAEAREAMEMPWASQQGLREAIPPAYTNWIGSALLAHLSRRELGEAA